jgi:DNA polymerase III epsilon subunit-like protein
MVTLIFDTETTGFADMKSTDHSRQPYPVQLACELIDNDNKTINMASIIINPGVPVPPDAAAIHGITTEKAEAYGMSLRAAAGLFINFLLKAERIVAHNIDFDLIITEAMIHRSELSYDLKRYKSIPRVCTMLSTMNILKLPGKYGNYKWPKLDESYKYLVDPSGFKGAHDALADVKACKAVLLALEAQGMELVSGKR